MFARLVGWFRNPLVLLALAAGLAAFVVQSGELGSADTMHRLQTTHWLWTSEPQVFPNEYPEFGLHGRGGRLYRRFGLRRRLLGNGLGRHGRSRGVRCRRRLTRRRDD